MDREELTSYKLLPFPHTLLEVSQIQANTFCWSLLIAYQQYEALYLAIGGVLDGKFLYEKVIYLSAAYLKKTSSLLGYSYVSSKSSVLLINEKLDLQVLISPIGGFEAFKRNCNTVCRGKSYLFWSKSCENLWKVTLKQNLIRL